MNQSYRINFAVLQRIQLKQLRTKLAKHAVSLRCEAGEPQGWQDTLKNYSKMTGVLLRSRSKGC